MRLDRIDDPLDAAWSQNATEPELPGSQVAIAGMSFAFPVVGIVAAIVDHFAIHKRFARVQSMLDALRVELEAVRSRAGGDPEKTREIDRRLSSVEFQVAAVEGAEQTVQVADAKRIDRIVAVLTGAIAPENLWNNGADLAGLVRDASQIDEGDVLSLRILYSTYEGIISGYPNLNVPNPFTERIRDVLKSVEDSKMHPDDFYSHCKRLEGFGLVIEAQRNSSRQAPGEYSFRPTLRGIQFVRLVSAGATRNEAS